MPRRAATLSVLALLTSLLLLVGPPACNLVAGLDKLQFAPDDAGPLCMSAVGCDDENPCTDDSCGAEGVCSHAAVSDGPSPVQLPGDCRTITCNAGQPSDADDDGDIPDDADPCTEDACSQGVATHLPLGEGAPCLMNAAKGTCKAGVCVVECGPGKPPCDDKEACTTDTCVVETGQCSFVALMEGAPNPEVPNVPGDCQAAVCAGGKPQTINDDLDVPAAVNDCQEGQCISGVPSAKIYALNTACVSAGGLFCDGSGACVACNDDGQCGPTNECESNTCAAHACTQTFTANNVPVAMQTPGDCLQNVCNGGGGVVSVADDGDPKSDGNPCTDDVCMGGVLSHPNTAMATVCGAGLVCNGMGACVGCVNDGQCTAPSTCGGCGMAQVCCCLPKTCAGLGLHCGSAPDGCGGTLMCNDGKNNGETDTDCGGPSCSVKCGQGKLCVSNADCAGGACADGVCCDSVCNGPCLSCNQPGKLGQCSPIVSGVDNNPAGSCTGTSTCDAAGACKKINGQPCAVNGDCAGFSCADGVCCNTNCSTQCKACNLAGSVGTCSSIPAGQADNNAALVCNGNNVCDGNAQCKKVNGQVCATGTECLSTSCTDGFCCNSACGVTCQSCGVPGSEGICTNLPSGQTDNFPANACNGVSACNGGSGALACKKVNGQICAANSECLSAACADGVCCNVGCNAACHACNLAGSVGTCTNIPSGMNDMTPPGTCQGTMTCDGAGACKSVLGQGCASGASCASGFCADNVCCNQLCSGTCQACSSAFKGGGSDGTCGFAQAGTDPRFDCMGVALCNGAGMCQ